MKNQFGVIVVTGLFCLSLFIPVSAVSLHILPDTPYDEDLSDRVITLDSVGNHTAGDVFTICGVTSLPAGRKLMVGMHLGAAGWVTVSGQNIWATRLWSTGARA